MKTPILKFQAWSRCAPPCVTSSLPFLTLPRPTHTPIRPERLAVWLHVLWQSALSWTGHNGSGRKCRHCLLISKNSTFKLSPSYHVLSACGKANSWLQLSDFLKVLICSFNRANDERPFSHGLWKVYNIWFSDVTSFQSKNFVQGP